MSEVYERGIDTNCIQHNVDGALSQEFYRWPLTTQAAKNALDVRYRLLDYLYTAFHAAHEDGTPVLRPLWYAFPKDEQTFAIDTQFLFGPSVLVSPVLEENATSVVAYFPDQMFYDFHTLKGTRGAGTTTLTDVNFTSIPVSIMGGTVLPLRASGAMTTTILRKTDFELVVAPGLDGTASGSLYVDDGVSIEQAKTTTVAFTFANGTLKVEGQFGYELGVNVARVRFANMQSAPGNVTLDGEVIDAIKVAFDADAGVLDVALDVPFDANFTLSSM